MPKIECSAHAVAASSAILDAVSEGALTPGDAAEISKLVKGFVRTLEASEFEERLMVLEGKTNASA